MALKVLSKSSIPSIFQKHCPSINPLSYLAAAQVFPMRVNSHVVNNLIDWYIERHHTQDEQPISLTRVCMCVCVSVMLIQVQGAS